MSILFGTADHLRPLPGHWAGRVTPVEPSGPPGLRGRAESLGKPKQLVLTAQVLERGVPKRSPRRRGPLSHPTWSGRDPPERVRGIRAHMIPRINPPTARVEEVVFHGALVRELRKVLHR